MAVLDRPDAGSEALLREAPVGLASAGTDGHFEVANVAFQRLLGYSEGELRRLSFNDITHPDDREACRRLWQDLRDGKRERFDFDKRWIRKDGSVIWTHVSVAAVRDARGRVQRAIGAALDITARRRAEDAVRLLGFLVDSADDAVIGADIDGKITCWNRGAEKLYGYAAAEALGREVTFHIPASRMLETVIIRERLLHGQAVSRLETERLRKDGSTVAVMVTASPVFDAEGRIVGASAIASDLTERKKAQEALQRLSAIVRSASDAVTAVDAWGRVTEWNAGAERLYGWKAEDIVGGDIMLIAPPDLLEEANWIREEVRAGRRIDRLETRRLRKDGTVVEVQLSVAPIRDLLGRVVGSAGISCDISARKHAEAELRRVNEELEKRVAARTAELENFNAAVSHDLRSPLVSLRHSLDILCASASLDERGRSTLDRAMTSERRMEQMIADMLELSRCRQADLHLERVDLSELARSIVAELRRREPDRRVEAAVAPGLSCFADPSLLRSALENLLSNAWKFTRNVERARVELGAAEQDGERVFFVRDNGAGFDMAYAHKLFQPFNRLHAKRDFEGSGVGLTIVRSVVERHGGRVWASAAIDAGATFFFTLPGA